MLAFVRYGSLLVKCVVSCVVKSGLGRQSYSQDILRRLMDQAWKVAGHRPALKQEGTTQRG